MSHSTGGEGIEQGGGWESPWRRGPVSTAARSHCRQARAADPLLGCRWEPLTGDLTFWLIVNGRHQALMLHRAGGARWQQARKAHTQAPERAGRGRVRALTRVLADPHLHGHVPTEAQETVPHHTQTPGAPEAPESAHSATHKPGHPQVCPDPRTDSAICPRKLETHHMVSTCRHTHTGQDIRT